MNPSGDIVHGTLGDELDLATLLIEHGPVTVLSHQPILCIQREVAGPRLDTAAPSSPLT